MSGLYNKKTFYDLKLLIHITEKCNVFQAYLLFMIIEWANPLI